VETIGYGHDGGGNNRGGGGNTRGGVATIGVWWKQQGWGGNNRAWSWKQ
jgi:hypothetical protein